jgi:drug/metabolite transporter (DMT)-like permease
MHFNFSFQIYAWVASILFAIEALQVKIISNHQVKNPWLLNGFWTFCVFIINTAVCLWAGAGVPSAWGNIFLAGLFFAIATSLFIFANYRLDVSTLSPLYNFRTIFVVILGALFLGEILTVTQLVLIGIMVLGGILVSFDERFSLKSFFSRGVLFALADMVALALMALFLKKAFVESGFWTVNLWYYFIATALLCLTLPFFYKDVKTLNKTQMGSMLLAAVAGAAGNFAANKAYVTNIGISGAILSIPLSAIAVMLIAPFYPKLLEHHTAKVYIIRIAAAAVLVYAGIRLS